MTDTRRSAASASRIKDALVAFMDITFILFLCFIILLATMLATKHLPSGLVDGTYHIGWALLGAVIISMTAYMVFMVKVSVSELHEMLSSVSAEKEEKL